MNIILLECKEGFWCWGGSEAPRWILAAVGVFGLFYTMVKLRDYRANSEKRQQELDSLRTQALNQFGINESVKNMLSESQKQTKALQEQVAELGKTNVILSEQLGVKINQRKKEIMPFFQQSPNGAARTAENKLTIILCNFGGRATDLKVNTTGNSTGWYNVEFQGQFNYVDNSVEIEILLQHATAISLPITTVPFQIELEFKDEDGQAYMQLVEGSYNKYLTQIPQEVNEEDREETTEQ